MYKLSMYAIAVLAMLFGVWVRNTLNKKSGNALLKKLRAGTLAIQDIVPELIWLVESCAKAEVDFANISLLKAGKKIHTPRGDFNIEYIELLENNDLVIAVFGNKDDTVGTVNHKNTALYFFLIHFNAANDCYEVKSEISTQLSEKLFKKEFAQALLFAKPLDRNNAEDAFDEEEEE